MKIVGMDVFPIRLRLAYPIPMASGVIATTGNALVRLTAEDGTTGWGEGVEAPALTGHAQKDIVSDLEEMRPIVVGEDPRRIADIWNRLKTFRPGASTALGAIDVALHDLVGKAYELPVHALIGGAVRERVPALTLVGSGNTDTDLRSLKEKRDRGFYWFKMKVGMAPRATELHTIERAAEMIEGDGVICADANEAWSEQEAVAFLKGLDGLPIRFLEQPVPRGDNELLLRVAEQSPIPICADEGAPDLASIIALSRSSVGGVSLKLIKHGGITGIIRGGIICSTGGLAVNLAGKVIESSISAAANLHAAAALDAVEFGCSPANQGVLADVTSDPIVVADGEFRVPSAPGLGVDVDLSLVEKLVS